MTFANELFSGGRRKKLNVELVPLLSTTVCGSYKGENQSG